VTDGTLVEQGGLVHAGGDAAFPVPPEIGAELAVYIRRAVLDEARNLNLGPGKATLTWCDGSGSCALEASYDVLRAASASDFTDFTVCLESGQLGGHASDPAVPATGAAFHYLVRHLSSCPSGESSLGADSAGNPRIGRSCP
jgi:hypothetical protein